ncbi:MAG: tetratricopeptide repeat protein [Longimicrobiales bacterium]
MADKRSISVFIASPGDLAIERRAFRDCIVKLNEGFGEGANVEFEALGWEDTLATTGRRNQGVINQEIDRCDVFILTMYLRWGQEAPDSEFSSYTEEEFHRALERFKDTGRPEIFVILKKISASRMADPGPQLKQVLDFRRELEKTRTILYREYTGKAQFGDEVNRHLKAYAKGELPQPDETARDIVVLPVESVQAVREAKEEATRERERAEKATRQAEAANELAEAEKQRAEAEKARREELELQLAERAAQAALDGRVEEARQTFAQVTESTTDLVILFLAYEFYFRIGDLDVAEQLCERWLALSGPDARNSNTAGALGNLGLIYGTRGDLDRAEEMHLKALEIDEELGRKERMATKYGNLGNVYLTRGELDRAEEMHLKSLKIEKELGHKEGMAADYGNLGLVYRTRGELDRAEEMHLKALEIDEELGRKEGMASHYAALGLVYFAREELDRAEEMHNQGLAIELELGRKEGTARQYGNLGNVYDERDDLNRAEEMYLKAMEINEELGSKEGMAITYANLGGIAEDRGDAVKARELWTKSRDLYEKIGIPHKVEKVQGWLDELESGSDGDSDDGA